MTSAERRLLRRRFDSAAAGLQRELARRRHPLSAAPPDRRYTTSQLLQRLRHYRRLAKILSGDPAPPPPLDFIAAELALTRSATFWVTRQPFDRLTKRRLLAMLDVEARFFARLPAAAAAQKVINRRKRKENQMKKLCVLCDETSCSVYKHRTERSVR